jgi:RecA/RadA recombinase
MGQIERQFGKGAIMKLGARPVVDIPVISTGSLANWTAPWASADCPAGA